MYGCAAAEGLPRVERALALSSRGGLLNHMNELDRISNRVINLIEERAPHVKMILILRSATDSCAVAYGFGDDLDTLLAMRPYLRSLQTRVHRTRLL